MPLAARSLPAPVALAAAIMLLATGAQAVEVKFQPVADGVYAHIGDTGPRSLDNEGLNANLGLVVTPAGAVLIDSGATYRSARQIHDAVKKVTPQPVKWVINTGGQDHRWLGNGYFREQGAEVIAHADARADMQARGGDHLAGLKATLQDRADGTVPTLPARFVSGTVSRLDLGGVVFQLEHRNGAHTPGDTMVWLPQKSVLFAGDVVYVDRLLGVIPVSNTRNWLETLRGHRSARSESHRARPRQGDGPCHRPRRHPGVSAGTARPHEAGGRRRRGLERRGEVVRRPTVHAPAERSGTDAGQRQPHLPRARARVIASRPLGTIHSRSFRMDIKVLGTGCANCRTTIALIEQVAQARGVAVNLSKVEELRDIMSYGVMSTPGVVIDGKVVHAGGVPGRDKIEHWLAAAD